MEALFQGNGLVIDVPEEVNNLDPVDQEEHKNSTENAANGAPNSSVPNRTDELPSHLRSINDLVAGLQVNQPPNAPVQPGA